ncbi:hypothetical protein C7B65_24060 [Phormidesmis priestleyi ULC007]|uniref:Calx-beta domain-containing protein n=1 Tax=Phormidesmis priestleyi ULC007 TaxID=1920490 RepID=A0A2T1D548_9CYAN|nr:Calx-beta domain-containing protein [Phormidesmis priestleyi]PSB15610.1 hypothetical protein C7B65_24060 [Phormidesmis priestleyi ULC007]
MPLSSQTFTTASLVRITDTSQWSTASPDPDGVTYNPDTGMLMISDSEVEETTGATFTGKNVYNVSLSGVLQSTLTTIGFSNEPTGISYNSINKHLYFSDDDKLKIWDVNPGADGKFNTSDDSRTWFDVSSFNGPHTDAEDVVFDPNRGTLFIIDGFNTEVYEVTTTGTLLNHFDTAVFGLNDPEGITVGPNGNLFIVGNPFGMGNEVFQITPTGSLVGTIDISAANPYKPAGLTFAPSSDNLNGYSLYIVDRGVDNVAPTLYENDGRLYEFAFATTSPPPPGILAFGTPTFSVNEDGTAISSVQVTRTGGSNGAVSAVVNLTNGTATAPGDYTNSPITVSFANGDSATKTITIPIINDLLVESNETINLSLGSATNGATIGSQNTAVLTIIDNDAPVGTLAFSTPTFSVNEDGTAISSVQVTRTGGSNGAVSAVVNLTNGTATAPGDYTNSPITVSFANGDSATKTITIPIINDLLVESNETINLSLGSATNGATIGSQNTAVLTIIDNDAPVGTLAFSTPTFSVNEDGTAISSVQVTRTGGSNGAVSAVVNLTNGTATAPGDYTNSPITVSFANGDSATKTITIPIINDSLVESNETINLSLGSATNGAIIGSQNTAVLTIVDNDVVAPQATIHYISTASNGATSGSGTVGGISFKDEDILAYNESTSTWSKYFKGANVGLGGTPNVRDFHINADGSILLSVNQDVTLPGAGTVTGVDIVKFTPTAIGEATAGSFSLYFKGANVGLDTTGEELDSLAIAPDGRIIVSTKGSFSAGGLTASNRDLLAFTPTSLGTTTAGSWSLYFKGSNVGLVDATENIDAAWVDNSGKIALSTTGAYTVPSGSTSSLSGVGSDVLSFTPSNPTSLGAATSGVFAASWSAAGSGLPSTIGIDGYSRRSV